MSYTAQLRGLNIGAGTVYRWSSFPAGFGLPPVRSDDIMLPDRDGELAGIDRLAGRTLVFEVYCLEDDAATVEATANFLKAAWRPSDTDLELKFTLARGEYSLFGRPRACDVVITKTLLGGVLAARLEFKAMDPRLFGIENATTIALPGGGTGLTFNATPNFSFGGAATGGEDTIANDDVVDTDWTADFNGPLTDPSIEHVETGYALRLTGSILTGETLTLDSRTRSIVLNGTSSRYSWLNGGSRWFVFVPGSNTVRFRANAGSGNVVITWRNASV